MPKIRKLTSMRLALVLSLALAVPCFAAGVTDADESDDIYLELGDTYTDPESGLTFSLTPSESFSEAEIEAVRNGIALSSIHYYERGTEITGAPFRATYDTDPSYGDVFSVRIDNEPLKEGSVRGKLYCNYNGTKDITVSFGDVGTLAVWSGNSSVGISGSITLSLIGNPQLRTWFDVYQYWNY